MTARKALALLDGAWYRGVVKYARWMDLIGDYAGSERFIVDGESLLQEVLNDPLLAIGRAEDPGFQIVHALYSMEHLLKELMQRNAVFDVVFWHDNHYLTLNGDEQYAVTSRALARRLLFNHLVKNAGEIGLKVYVFETLSDPAWDSYRKMYQVTMFVMLNDGGTPADIDELEACSLLVQREFIFTLLAQGVSVSHLRGAEFIDSKVFSFVLEQRYNAQAKEKFPVGPKLWHSVEKARDVLRSVPRPFRSQDTRLVVSPSSKAFDVGLVLQELVEASKHAVATDPAFCSGAFWELLYAYLVHLLLLDSLSLGDRSGPVEAWDVESDKVSRAFLLHVYAELVTILAHSTVVLDMDGMVFARLLRFLAMHVTITPISSLIGDDIHSRAQSIWSTAAAPKVNLGKLATVLGTASPVEHEAPGPAGYKLIPFQNEFFDAELVSVHVSVSDEPVTSGQRREFSDGTPFQEVAHWHNDRRAILPKHLGGEDYKRDEEWQRLKTLRREQWHMRDMQRVAATLTGASGTSLQQIRITPTGRTVEEVINSSAGPTRPARPIIEQKGKQPPLRSADKIRQQNADDKKAKDDATSQNWWREQLARMEKMTDAQKDTHVSSLFRNPRSYQVDWLSAEMRVYQADVKLRLWTAEATPDEATVRDAYSVAIIQLAKNLYSSRGLTPSILLWLKSVFLSLGFENYVAPLEVSAVSRVSSERALSFKPLKLVKSKSQQPIYPFMHIVENPVTWQLRLFGEYMDRSMDSQPDSRVAFQPDGWQRRVLDCLDRPKCSVLVVAPTSAGKTFISFYAMEKVLRESDNGILVYVAPTKALVNQVAAEVYARFSKDIDGRSCWAIHTRDYRTHDPQKCQILVTVPEVLAIMLLSPPLASKWTPRIRRIILDEIHTIGQQEGGVVWEQILLLAPCPIIGLSATVGEPEAFNSWLQSVQTSKGLEHEFIHHPHRYSHLRKYAYLPQLLADGKQFRGLDKTSLADPMMRYIHPMSALSFGAISLPPDLSLESQDALVLYQALQSTGNTAVAQMDPVNFFSSEVFIRQRDILSYEESIKSAVVPLLKENGSGAAVAINKLVSHPQIQDPIMSRIDSDVLNTPPDNNTFMSGLIHLLWELHVRGNLPAILFDFDRHECELMAHRILDDLTTAEEEWRDTDARWKNKIQAWQTWKTAQQARNRQQEKLVRKKKVMEEESQTQETVWQSSFDPSIPSAQFSFANTAAYSAEDLREDIDQLRWTSIKPWFFEALWRGVGVHHSGMNKQYRSLIERLFRIGFLRVVIATGTLALGINAPAKTSVFCGDSPFLTALTYRQCAGRAGRRGFDLLGRVVFYGLPIDRIHRLMLSRLPRLTGTFPLSSTLVLRLFDLLHGSKYSPYAVRAVRSIVRLPQISFGSEIGGSQLLHHLRFSIEYLRRAHLLDGEGNPMNLFAIASHIYHTEPSNFALVALLQSGVVHDICNGPNAQEELVVLLCHLFGRRNLPEAYATADNVRDLIRSGPSRVVLPRMDARARDVLLAHQEETTRIFTAYAFEFASQHATALGQDDSLPLSQTVFGASRDTDVTPTSPLHVYLNSTAISPIVRSPFVANSGHSDRFANIEDLASTVRRGIHLNGHAIPSFERITATPEDSRKPFVLNAYLYDFYMHGQDAALVNMNGIRRGDVWYVLQDFHLTLTAIRSAVHQMIVKRGGQQVLDSQFLETLDPAEQDADVEDPERPVVSDSESSTSGEEAPKDDSKKRDWKVYQVLDTVTEEFGRKFRAMWA
ncbi:P-loop containing nucleoside triphosphate hydrolase protein [Auriscalpium vulgare]|uniref:P-loop containing nucleoside triphosphate hydrolase protein n=1 Tax=Auriscalpium vulgare TaxID=40419 RepID=A0ACB8RYC0_9AGAM|nr:P-loop containing nucleoside triphosphate hydrolase protein [Auriscalpium vulgare]